ncbi:ABC transporter substrate-binding protein [Afipia sp. P52-10]|jgi:tripartite-type tricarboxylate transporter receptor subunit TctC|uniref:Bug family tripartite tricarboxylate transporter substrate binding protein n=1 Tax=Afipia sp. P52-10 TaxID=1429916 RepID=UPI0003DF418E|nr:tripartite tricarboxylate transporter substrate binding protein [Afipia sp. P52-10]ETR78290.1 ABC transporter substrate-binding protein [Afipia sp. P52-10]
MVRLVCVLMAALLAAPMASAAPGYPDRPVKIIVPFSPGSGGDTVARMVADELRKSLGGSFVVENRPGASGQIGTEAAAKSPADGYTLLQTSSAQNSAGPWLVKTLSYDPIKDFAHIARVITVPFLLVVPPELPVKTVQEFIDYARKNPGLAYGHGSATAQVASATFSTLAGLNTMNVPYKSQPPAVIDLMAGRIQFMMADLSVVGEQVKAGKLKALAITARNRSPGFPDVPTLAEQGMTGFDLEVWVGIGAPAGTPEAIVKLLSGEIMKMGQRDDVRQRFQAVGFDLAPNTVSDHAAFLREQLDSWGRRIKDAGIQPE